MKIALFLPSLAGGGAERVLVALANEFCAEHQVELIVASRQSPAYLDEISEAVTVSFLGRERVLFAVPALARQLARFRPDVVLTTLGHSAVGVTLARRLVPGLRCRIYVREAISVEFKDQAMAGLKSTVYRAVIGWCYRRADAVVATSEAMRDGLQRYYRLASPIPVIGNPVIDTDFQSRVDAAPAVELPWEHGTAVILGVGRLSKQKDFDTLIRAFALARTRIEARLVILGEGPERPALEALVDELGIESDCYLPGFVVNPLPLFARSDLYVMSSRYEGLPNALIQALASGTRCVSTDCPTGPADVLDGGRLGRLVPVGNVESLAGAIVDSLAEPRPSADTVATTHRRYRSDRVAAQYLALMSGSSVTT